MTKLYHDWVLPGDIAILQAEESDAKAFSVFREIASSESEYINDANVSEAKRILKTTLDDDRQFVFLAFSKEKVVGQLFLEVVKTVCYIRLISILSEFYGTGLADRLFKVAKEKASENECETIKLIVNNKNERAISYYKKIGFDDGREYSKRATEMTYQLKAKKKA